MLKRDERLVAGSCWNKARDDEFVFVLLERDVAAVETIRFWCDERIRLGKNSPSDPQIAEALGWCDRVERFRGVEFCQTRNVGEVEAIRGLCHGLGASKDEAVANLELVERSRRAPELSPHGTANKPDPVNPCTRPPAGWLCTRTAGHPGPCAAVPVAPFDDGNSGTKRKSDVGIDR